MIEVPDQQREQQVLRWAGLQVKRSVWEPWTVFVAVAEERSLEPSLFQGLHFQGYSETQNVASTEMRVWIKESTSHLSLDGLTLLGV